MLLLLTPSLYLEQSPNVSFLIENEYFFRSLPKNYRHHVYYGNFSGLSMDHFVFMKTYRNTLRRVFMKGYFSGECSHRVCVDGTKKIIFSNKNDSCGRGLKLPTRKLQQRLRRRQRERQKGNRYRLAKTTKLCTCSTLFWYVFCRQCTTTM